MTATEAPSRFELLLAEHGVVLARPDPGATWRAFLRFAAEPVVDAASEDSDSLFFEAGPTKYGPNRRPALMIEFERQIMIEREGEYEGTRSLLCSFALPPDPSRKQVQVRGWPGADADAWAQRVEATGYLALFERADIEGRIELGWV